MAIIKMLSIPSLSRRRLGLPQLGFSSGWPRLISYCLVFTAFLFLTLTFYSIPYSKAPELEPYDGHPRHQIPTLMAVGDQKWESMLARQSQTLDKAVTEYRTRYSLDPPDGFDEWFHYAKSKNVKLVDEYDMLMSSLVPLRQLGPVELRRRTELLDRAPVDINSIRIGGNGKLELVHFLGRTERTKGLMTMLEPVQHLLAKRNWKEFDVVVNELAESRVIGGEWHTDALDQATGGDLVGRKLSDEVWEKHEFGDRSLIDSVMIACGPDSIFTKAKPGFDVHETQGNETEIETHRFEDQNWLDDMDICSHPELPRLHSAFRTMHHTTKGLYPILSYGSPSAYSDITIPTIYQYGGNPDYTLKKGDDRSWRKKENGIYWRGSPTGGGRGDKEFGSMHRHRLVSMTNPPMPPPPKGSKPLKMTILGADAQNRLMSAPVTKDIYNEQFTNITFVAVEKSNCYYFECNDLGTYFKFEKKKPLSEVWRWKMAIDIDGWGYSARWRALIASKSMALKTTIYHEWYTERMVPWVHFVPISPKMNELHDVLGYFLGGGEEAPLIVPHDEQAKQIAVAGSKWAAEHMRNEDMTVYVYRLILEMNRLYNGEGEIYKHPSS